LEPLRILNLFLIFKILVHIYVNKIDQLQLDLIFYLASFL